MRPAIEAAGLSRSFGGVRAVDGLSLAVGPGELLALLGPDGAGKTTALRLLAGALEPDAGTAYLGGIDIALHPEQARARLGYLPQRFSLYGELTVRENLHFLAELRGLPPAEWQERAARILAFVGLSEYGHRRARELSGGMRQKLGLAAALVHRPAVLLLDEPTAGVDPVTRQAFWRLLTRLLGEGVAILITTPYLDEAARCSRVGFLDRGRLLVEGTPAALRAPLRGRVLEVTGAEAADLLGPAEAFTEVEEAIAFGAGVRLRLASGAGPGAGERLTAALRAAGLPAAVARTVTPSLDDVFRRLLSGGRR